MDCGSSTASLAPPPPPSAEADNPNVFLDIAIGGAPAGRLVLELYADVVPKTAENFRALCTGEKGQGTSGKPLHFKGSVFHRIIPGFMCQGGMKSSEGGESIYGPKFADESFQGKAGKHQGFGTLSMVNKGPNTNGSGFFICTAETSHLDGKHVVFGKMIEGEKFLRAMEKEGSRNGRTAKNVTIVDCGQL